MVFAPKKVGPHRSSPTPVRHPACCATAPFTNPKPPLMLDETYSALREEKQRIYLERPDHVASQPTMACEQKQFYGPDGSLYEISVFLRERRSAKTYQVTCASSVEPSLRMIESSSGVPGISEPMALPSNAATSCSGRRKRLIASCSEQAFLSIRMLIAAYTFCPSCTGTAMLQTFPPYSCML